MAAPIELAGGVMCIVAGTNSDGLFLSRHPNLKSKGLWQPEREDERPETVRQWIQAMSFSLTRPAQGRLGSKSQSQDNAGTEFHRCGKAAYHQEENLRSSV
jgi:hypothetical protein